MKLRFLDPEKDLRHFEAAWNWQFAKPRWWRELFAIWEESKEEFLEKRFKAEIVFFGVFHRRALVGLIYLEAVGGDVYEAHFDAARGTSLNILRDAIFDVRAHVFSHGARSVYIFVAKRNRPLLRLCDACGFEKTNVGILFGEAAGKIAHWEQLVLKN